MDDVKEAVAYCRVSTLEQKRRGYGIDIRIRDVTLFAEGQGFAVRRIYRDEAESGVREDRGELRRLLKDCRAKRVRVVIIPSLDWLSRDVRIAGTSFTSSERFGVQVHSSRTCRCTRPRSQGYAGPADPRGYRRGESERHHRTALEGAPGADSRRSAHLAGTCFAGSSGTRSAPQPQMHQISLRCN